MGTSPTPRAAPAPHLDPGPLALRGFALQPGADGAPELGEQLLHHQVAEDLWREAGGFWGSLLGPPHVTPSQPGLGVRVLTWVSFPQSMSQVPYCSLDCRYMRMASVKAGASTLESSEIPAEGTRGRVSSLEVGMRGGPAPPAHLCVDLCKPPGLSAGLGDPVPSRCP